MTYNLYLELGISALLICFFYFVGWKEIIKPAFVDCGMISDKDNKINKGNKTK